MFFPLLFLHFFRKLVGNLIELQSRAERIQYVNRGSSNIIEFVRFVEMITFQYNLLLKPHCTFNLIVVSNVVEIATKKENKDNLIS